MKAIFFCYSEDTSTMSKLLDQVLIISVISWFVLVFLDWSYWKAAPYSLHTFILYGITFTVLFIRFCDSLDFKRAMRELNYAPRLIAAFLSSLNGIVCNIVLVKCRS